MTPKQIELSRALCDAATPGKWSWADGRLFHDGAEVGESFAKLDALQADIFFLIHARTVLPMALDEIERLQSHVTQLQNTGTRLVEENRRLQRVIMEMPETK